MRYTILLATLFLPACATVPATPAPSAPVNYDKGWSYDAFVDGEITHDVIALIPGDLCPHPKGDRWENELWRKLIKCTAQAESGYDPNQDYTEKFPDSHGVRQVSSGLLQLSLDDKAKGTPWCLKLTPATIHDPHVNLGCGIEIMNWCNLKFTGTFRERLGNYWSTIRDRKVDNCLHHEIPDCFIP